MGFAAFTFVVIFLLIASGGLLLFYRATMLQRISAVVTPRTAQSGLFRRLQRRVSVGGVVQRFERVMPKSQAEVSVVQQRLIRAGIRSEADRLGWSFSIHRTDRPAPELLLALHARIGAGAGYERMQPQASPRSAVSA